MADYGLNFDDFVVDDSPALNTEDIGSDFFSPDVVVEARTLAKYSVKTLIAEIVRRSANIPGLDFSRPESEWPAKAFAAYCAIVSTLGGKRMVDRALGILDVEDLPYLAEVHLEVIQAAITTEKTMALTVYSDLTLAREAAKMKGAEIVSGNGASVYIRVPGCDIPIEISATGDNRGRVVGGGEAFVRWHNLHHSTVYVYRPTSSVARGVAFSAFVLYDIKIDKGVLLMKDKARRKRTAFTDLVGEISNAMYSQRMNIRKLVENAWNDKSCHVNMGKNHFRDVLEVMLTTVFDSISGENREKVEGMVKRIQIDVDNQWRRIRENLYLFSGPSEDIDRKVVGAFAEGKKDVAGRSLGDMGSVRLFVEESRVVFRDDNDLMRKSDSVPAGFSVGEASSVPEKILRCISALRSISPVTGKFPHVHAFGTGAHNHMSAVVEEASHKVHYYDINKDYSPPNGGTFSQQNIETLETTSGRGKYVFDDTYTGPDGGTGPSKFNATKKIESIIRADYDGGFMKLYYGAGSEATVRIGTLPPTLEKLMNHYERILLVPGGSVHTPEYFVVFSHAPDRLYAPAGIDDKGFKLGYVPSYVSLAIVAIKNYLLSWLAYRAVEIVRANLSLNVQVAVGYYGGYSVSTRTGFAGFPRIPLGGSNVIGVTAVKEREVGDMDVSFLDDIEAPIAETEGQDVGMLGSGNSKGDGPSTETVAQAKLRQRVASNAVQLAYNTKRYEMRTTFPTGIVEEDGTVYGLPISMLPIVFANDPINMSNVNAPEFKGMVTHTKLDISSRSDTLGVTVYVPARKDVIMWVVSPIRGNTFYAVKLVY